MKKALVYGAMVLIGSLGMSVRATATDQDRDELRRHELHELRAKDRAKLKEREHRRDEWVRRQREQRAKRREWAREHHAHVHPAATPVPNQPVPPPHAFQAHREHMEHVKDPATQGK